MAHDRRQRKIGGRFCEEQRIPASKFKRGSFRWLRSGRSSWLLLGRLKKQQVMSVHKILHRTRKGMRCPVGFMRIDK